MYEYARARDHVDELLERYPHVAHIEFGDGWMTVRGHRDRSITTYSPSPLRVNEAMDLCERAAERWGVDKKEEAIKPNILDKRFSEGFDEITLNAFDFQGGLGERRTPNAAQCECGVQHTGGIHSHYCPLGGGS